MSVLPAGSFGALITDPPYSSGGFSMSQVGRPTAIKYTSSDRATEADFDGDAKSQRSWTRWLCEILRESRRLLAPGSPVCLFCDWRQLPSLTDAMQWADVRHMGIAVWNKGNSRPQPGRFRQDCEFIAWGAVGEMSVKRNAPYLPGCFAVSSVSPSRRTHQTEKPLELMRQIVRIAEPGAAVLDPFAGSGTTLLAAALEGYGATGIEVSERFAVAARERLAGFGV
jgi:site-specific DNA-methyltransferase (adenine-specific)